jgi:hypothetical protein
MTSAPASAANRARLDDLRIAWIHLRLGQMTLARAELEDLLRRDQLDIPGLAVLAEARWRTGDAEAAADAARIHLEGGGSDEVALCIAAEAAAADGRPGEARAVMERLPLADAATLDVLFAGMPRRAFWPAGPADKSELEDLRADAGFRAGGRRGSPGERMPRRDAPTPAFRHGDDLPADRRAIPGPREVLEATAAAAKAGSDQAGGGGAAAAESEAGATGRTGSRGQRAAERRGKGEFDPGEQLRRARDELDKKPDRAFMRLALVLRHDPTYAPDVLAALNLRHDPAAALLRGDAQRLLGRHLEAEADFDAAAESLEAS